MAPIKAPNSPGLSHNICGMTTSSFREKGKSLFFSLKKFHPLDKSSTT
jgi:hypothetical protein